MTGLPAGPRLPVALQMLRWLKRPLPFLLRSQREFGDVFTVTIAPNEGPWVILAEPAAVKEVFTGDPEVFRAGEGNAVLGPLLGRQSVLLLDGAEHLRERKLLLPPFHGERMQRYGELMRSLAEQEVASWPRGTNFPLQPRMQALTLEIIVQAIFGVRSGTRLQELRTRLGRIIELTTTPSAFLAIALLGSRVDKVPTMARALREVDETIHAVIAERRRAPDLDEREDILSMLLTAGDLDDRALRDELMTLLVAGHETTATSLAWAMERLLRHPEQLERLRTDPDFADAVCTETLRLRPVLPVVLRRLTEPRTIAGYDLPAGVKVAPCIALVQRRADLYADPHAFRPERWLGRKPGTYEWFPFGGGVRRCLGAAFALFEMRTVLQAIVEHAQLEPVRPQDEAIGRRAITLVPEHGTEVLVT